MPAPVSHRGHFLRPATLIPRTTDFELCSVAAARPRQQARPVASKSLAS